jgi:hypothetical protein
MPLTSWRNPADPGRKAATKPLKTDMAADATPCCEACYDTLGSFFNGKLATDHQPLSEIGFVFSNCLRASPLVIPAKAGIHDHKLHTWIPAFAGMTTTHTVATDWVRFFKWPDSDRERSREDVSRTSSKAS